MLEISDVESSRNVLSIHESKIKALISCAATAQLICAFVFAYSKSRFSHDVISKTATTFTKYLSLVIALQADWCLTWSESVEVEISHD